MQQGVSTKCKKKYYNIVLEIKYINWLISVNIYNMYIVLFALRTNLQLQSMIVLIWIVGRRDLDIQNVLLFQKQSFFS